MTVLELVEITVYCFYHLFKLLSCSALPGSNELLDDHRALEPPDPIPNSEVKRCIADGSVRFPHVRVGHRQALYQNPGYRKMTGVLLCALEKRKPAKNLKDAHAHAHAHAHTPVILANAGIH